MPPCQRHGSYAAYRLYLSIVWSGTWIYLGAFDLGKLSKPTGPRVLRQILKQQENEWFPSRALCGLLGGLFAKLLQGLTVPGFERM